jgi:hypothetical protein
MDVYLDAVLDVNANPIFNGTTEEVVEWLCQTADNRRMQESLRICVGRTLEMKSIDDYLRAYEASQK